MIRPMIAAGITGVALAVTLSGCSSSAAVRDACAATLPSFTTLAAATTTWSEGDDATRTAWEEYLAESHGYIAEMWEATDNDQMRDVLDTMTSQRFSAHETHVELFYSVDVDDQVKISRVSAVLFGALDEYADLCGGAP